jgi:regulatory protein
LAVNNKFRATLFFNYGKCNGKNVNDIFNFEHVLENKRKISVSLEQGLLKAANYCAYQERCHKEVLIKLEELGIRHDDANQIILQLIEQGYLNEERFAKSFARGKFRTKKWGKAKITLELKIRQISDYNIRVALQEISDDEYIETLQYLIKKKWTDSNKENSMIKKAKIAQFASGKGFERSLIWDLLRQY